MVSRGQCARQPAGDGVWCEEAGEKQRRWVDETIADKVTQPTTIPCYCCTITNPLPHQPSSSVVVVVAQLGLPADYRGPHTSAVDGRKYPHPESKVVSDAMRAVV
ncbi:hypothetical protein KIN20_010621 [Parelaphostrongylus tenuis]|uniref:Uncharacterized protein n=1 Tax=Parelaphostrongylus tenuis TaxID=148309 RepID=A0AAD5MS53_PARTN|nr:hypothetical protein KIN20_010621 [Parelaphostrongylus tenuis]